MDKPLSIQIEETKQAIVTAINNSSLHPFILDSILKDIYNEMHILYINQVTQDKKDYLQEKDSKKSTK